MSEGKSWIWLIHRNTAKITEWMLFRKHPGLVLFSGVDVLPWASASALGKSLLSKDPQELATLASFCISHGGGGSLATPHGSNPSSAVTLDKLLNHSVPQFPYL